MLLVVPMTEGMSAAYDKFVSGEPSSLAAHGLGWLCCAGCIVLMPQVAAGVCVSLGATKLIAAVVKANR